MQVNTLDEYLDRYVDNYLLADLISVTKNVPAKQAGNAAYLITAAVCSGMELMGSITTSFDILPGCDVCEKPEQARFKFPIDHYCIHYMAQVDERYKAFGQIARELVRNGIAHTFATKGKVAITRMGDKNNHLTRMTDEGFLVVNADCFFEDFKRSYYEFARPSINEGGEMRSTALKNYEIMRKFKEVEIERTMSASEKKLASWPVVGREIYFDMRMVDEIEETGEIQVVS